MRIFGLEKVIVVKVRYRFLGDWCCLFIGFFFYLFDIKNNLFWMFNCFNYSVNILYVLVMGVIFNYYYM